MKLSLLLALSPLVLAQTLAPSPAESIGCEAHGDHWHCDGPRSTLVTITTGPTATGATAVPTTAISKSHDHDHESESDHHHEHSSTDAHDHDAHATASLKPSPTESTGCTPHGDHWHCTGTKADATGGASAAATSPVPAGSGRFSVQEALMAGAMGLAVVYNIVS